MTAEGPKEISTDEIFKGKKVVLFAVPGAFTPTCSAKHLPGFVQNAAAIKAKGVDTIACLAVNDAFVMGAWGKDAEHRRQGADARRRQRQLHQGAGPRDGRQRPRPRHALASATPWSSQDGVVKTLNVEAPGAFEVSSAEAVLKAL